MQARTECDGRASRHIETVHQHAALFVRGVPARRPKAIYAVCVYFQGGGQAHAPGLCVLGLFASPIEVGCG